MNRWLLRRDSMVDIDILDSGLTDNKAMRPFVRLRRVQTNIYGLIRELSGPCPLCRVPDICSKPRIWNRGARVISFGTRTTDEIMGPSKDRDPTPFRLTRSWCRLYGSTLNFTEPCCVEDSRYTSSVGQLCKPSGPSDIKFVGAPETVPSRGRMIT